MSVVKNLLGGGSPPAINVPPLPPAPPPPPTPVDPQVRKTRDTVRRRAAASAGRGSTIKTSPSGLSGQAQTTRKTLLGR